jgi:penicillin-binding protein 1C
MCAAAWVALADVSPALRTALVLSEDRRFYEHSGVDWRAVSSAAWGNLWNTRTRGASTLTCSWPGCWMARLPPSACGRAGRAQRGAEAGPGRGATQLETPLAQGPDSGGYLNLVPFRGEIVGIDALARTLFGKAAHGLDAREAAVAAALVRAPNAAPARVAQRACGVLRAMNPAPATPPATGEGGPAGVGPGRARARRRLRRAGPVRHRRAAAPRLAGQRRHRAASGAPPAPPAGHAAPPRVATLDASLQRFALQTLQRHLRELRGRHVEDGAVVVLDNASGEVLAWVGSSGELSRAAEVDGVLALRQPGSTLKPFLYAQAIAEQRLTAASLLDDAPTQIPTASGLYIPQNYDRQFKGWVSVRTALGASLNVPAVRTLVMVSPEAFAASCAPWACRFARPATTTATAWRWAAPRCRCWH